jgi:hypothetical protein
MRGSATEAIAVHRVDSGMPTIGCRCAAASGQVLHGQRRERASTPVTRSPSWRNATSK